jgi:hypothetical protein
MMNAKESRVREEPHRWSDRLEHAGDIEAKCVLCAAATDSDHFCYGCRSYICERCERPDTQAAFTLGMHTVRDHRVTVACHSSQYLHASAQNLPSVRKIR